MQRPVHPVPIATRVLGVALLLATPWLADAGELTFAPAAGTELSKVFATKVELSVEDVSIEINGAAFPLEALDPDLAIDELYLSAGYESTTEDTYERVGDGRPLSLTRRFVSVSGEYEDGFSESDFSEDEEFVVRFLWDEDAEAYECSFVEGRVEEDDDVLLEILDEDMDLRAFLPVDEVSPGDEWYVPLNELECLVLPGLGLGRALELFVEEEGEDEEGRVALEVWSAARAQLTETLSTTYFFCTLEEPRPFGDAELGVVALSCDLDFEIDLIDSVETLLREDDNLPESLELDRFSLSIDVELRGELLWDLAAGHLHAFDLDGELGGELEVSMQLDQDGIALSFSGTADLAGSLERTVRLED